MMMMGKKKKRKTRMNNVYRQNRTHESSSSYRSSIDEITPAN
ncbi:unnamed protein product [Spirodela intermedia]|uniref:Uncharacterized protein n=2 Tax=Spirodela intermedia TaxID=51605 RepID=A0A7I8KTA3_SPIIN|nr:unnamed protein product [Spirodela intermedia]CAA7401073.1 unnamed protein product [Spirodela intermedia]